MSEASNRNLHRAGRMWATRILTGVGLVAAALLAQAQTGPREPAAQAGTKFTLTSPDITNGQRIDAAQVYNRFGCAGGNVSPALSWSNPPAGTKSFALLVHDPDAPTGNGWWHWVVYDIPPDVTSLPADAGDPAKGLMPPGAEQGKSDFGTPGYGGPCPPPGKPHHYYFRLYALKVPKLEIPADATAAAIDVNVNRNSLGKAEIMGLYGR